MIKLFSNFIRTYHDGIIITDDDKILYNNSAVERIF